MYIMIRYIQGDLLASNLKVIAHGCNCRGAFGAGIARQIRITYPNVYEVYNLKHRVLGLELGSILPVRTLDGRIVVNCMTQQDCGNDGRVYLDYDALDRCMAAINDHVENWGETEVGMPKIGAGLAGGDWDRIEQIIIRNAKNFIPVVYIL